MSHPDDNENALNVFACERDDHTADEQPIGKADTKSQAARMINKFLSERDGHDPELRAANIVYSPTINGYFID